MDDHYLLKGILKGVERFAEVVDVTSYRLNGSPIKWAGAKLRVQPGREIELARFLSSRESQSQVLSVNQRRTQDGLYELQFTNRPGQTVSQEDYILALLSSYREQTPQSLAQSSTRLSNVTGQIDPAKIASDTRRCRRVSDRSRNNFASYSPIFGYRY
jgi:hypothetical protein